MIHYVHGLKYMTRSDWAWFTAKLCVGILAPLSVLFAVPTSVSRGIITMGPIWLVMGLMIFGGIVSGVGITVRATRVRPLVVGYAFELAGLIPLFTAPLLLAVIYFAAFLSGANTLTGAAFCLGLATLLIARFADIFTYNLSAKPEAEKHRRKGAK